MTPKEKAEELIIKYLRLQDFESYNWFDKYLAKKCALIAVDEMLYHVKMVDDNAAINYWEEVKQEIENN